MGPAEIAACVGVALAAAAVIVLIWIVSLRNINEQTADIRERAERMATAQAATLAEEIHLELAIVDQSLIILQEAWNRDQEHFDLLDWQKRVPALTEVARDVFIADEKRIVRQDIMPPAIGQGIGGAYLDFPHGTLEHVGEPGQVTRTGQLIFTEDGAPVETRRYLMYIVRPLEKPTNWLIGASYRTEELVKLYSKVAIGINGMVALIDSQRGILQAIAGPAARRPQSDISKSAMMTAFRAKPSGTWTGPTAMDGVNRIHGFAKVADRDMIVTVAIPAAEAMEPAGSVAEGEWWVAFAGSVLVAITATMILWAIFNRRASRRRQHNYTRMESNLASLEAEVATVRARALTAAGQVATLMRLSGKGLALLDGELQLTACNHRFATLAGVPPQALETDFPVDELFRRQAHAGLIVSENDEDPEAIEIEIARRVASLRTEPEGAALPQQGTDGSQIVIKADVIPDGGGLVLTIDEADT